MWCSPHNAWYPGHSTPCCMSETSFSIIKIAIGQQVLHQWWISGNMHLMQVYQLKIGWNPEAQGRYHYILPYKIDLKEIPPLQTTRRLWRTLTRAWRRKWLNWRPWNICEAGGRNRWTSGSSWIIPAHPNSLWYVTLNQTRSEWFYSIQTWIICKQLLDLDNKFSSFAYGLETIRDFGCHVRYLTILAIVVINPLLQLKWKMCKLTLLWIFQVR